MKVDAVVIGKGLAGFAAAATLRKAGKTVVSLYSHTGATSISSGAWSFSQLNEIVSLQELATKRNPFRELFCSLDEASLASRLSTNVDFVVSQLPQGFMATKYELPLCLPSTAGVWRKVYAAQSIQTKIDLLALSPSDRILLLGSPHWRFDAKGVSQRLEANAKKLGKAITVVPLLLSAPAFGNDMSLGHLAAKINANAEFRALVTSQVRDALASEKAQGLLLPPIFLETAHFKEFQSALSLPVAECLGALEPLPGFRLYREIQAALERLGVTTIGVDQIEPLTTDRAIQKVKIRKQDGSWDEIASSRYILASGRFFSGGVSIGYHTLKEPIFSLPLFVQGNTHSVENRSQLDWTQSRFAEPQTWATLGLKVNHSWQPLDSSGTPVFKNLFACGSGIGGGDLAHSGIGLGFMAFSGKECGDVVAKI